MAYSRKVKKRKVTGVRNWLKGREGKTTHRNRAKEKRGWK